MKPIQHDEYETGPASERFAAETRQFLFGAEIPSDIEALREDLRLHPSDDPSMIGRIGAYDIRGMVGRGGMGVVLKARDPHLDRFVAIKVLSPAFAHSVAARRRFEREAKAAAAVVHDNIIAIFGVNEHRGLPYLVMPYIAGESLQERIDREGPCELQAILDITLQITRGLGAAHVRGLVHRDIKPANILLPRSVSRVLITDFGLARAADDATMTRSGIISGTPRYMAPEQAMGDQVDGRSDLFSLGAVIYTLTCGHPPFRAEHPIAVLRRIVDEPHRDLHQLRDSLPQGFVAMVNRLLQKDPCDRFQSATELATHVEDLLARLRNPTLPEMNLETGYQTAPKNGSDITPISALEPVSPNEPAKMVAADAPGRPYPRRIVLGTLASLATISVLFLVFQLGRLGTSPGDQIEDANATTTTDQAEFETDSMTSSSQVLPATDFDEISLQLDRIENAIGDIQIQTDRW
ncbi:MAG: serine/threonine-protein kinase [Planctomycetota bacterium]